MQVTHSFSLALSPQSLSEESTGPQLIYFQLYPSFLGSEVQYLSVVFDVSEKVLYSVEDVGETVLACPNVLCCLRIVNLNFGCAKVLV